MEQNNSPESLHDKGKKPGMKTKKEFVNEGISPALVGENDRKTGKISDAANTALNNHVDGTEQTRS